jgi:N-acetyl-anhydromuramyl-L-alanine amidase AmpD
VGICLVGGVSEQGEPEANYTDAQWVALRELLTELMKQYPTAHVCGHNSFPGVTKACPCFDVRAWLAVQGMA